MMVQGTDIVIRGVKEHVGDQHRKTEAPSDDMLINAKKNTRNFAELVLDS